MREPTPRTSRLAIAAGLLAMLAVGGLGFLLGRAGQPQAAPAANQAAPAPDPAPAPPREEPRTFARADLVTMAAQAADAAASGAPVPDAVDEAAGRRFDLLLPFGCGGPAAGEGGAPLRWRYDEAEEVLRLHARPTSWTAADWDIGAATGIEAIEGFWIARPWSSSGACPAGTGRALVTGSEPVTLPGQTLAVAQFLPGDARREARRGARPFELVRRLPRAALDASRGFRLRLLGRIGRVPGGGPVRCVQPAGIEQRPICVIAVTLDEVRIENAATGAVLATWPVGGEVGTN